MTKEKFNNKRIAKNAIYLYLRMVVQMAISFYSSRVLLKELGINDYGVYNIVGGIVLIFDSLRSLFSSAIQRFINCEMGKVDGNVRKVFSIGFYTQFFISIVFVIVIEIAGYFIFQTINIPTDRLFAARFVFHLSIVTSVLSLLTVPFDSMIIANEKMNVYATISIIEAFGKLLIIFLLPMLLIDKLIVYAILVTFVSFSVCIANFLYCRFKFSEYRIKRCWDKSQFLEMFSFAGWNFLGNTTYSLTNEGINFVLNHFGGVTVNAARGISYQLKGAISRIISTLNVAYRPQCVILYSQGKFDDYYKLTFQSCKLTVFLYNIVAIPFFIFTPFVVNLWLGTTPDYSVIFVRTILLYILVRTIHEPLDTLFLTAGKIKQYQLLEMIILVMSLPLSYIFLFFGSDYYMVFVSMTIMEIINIMAVIILAKNQLQFPISRYIRSVIMPILFSLFITIFLHLLFIKYICIPECTIINLLYIILDIIINVIISAATLLDSQQLKNILKKINL